MNKRLKNKVLLLTLFIVSVVSVEGAKIKHITASEFKKVIFDYQSETKWNNKTKKPILIDFYATWCGPCRKVAPILEKLQDRFKGELTIYKVDVDKERELASVFAIKSMPTFLFIPEKGSPAKAVGALSEQTFLKAFKDIYSIE